MALAGKLFQLFIVRIVKNLHKKWFLYIVKTRKKGGLGTQDYSSYRDWSESGENCSQLYLSWNSYDYIHD